MFKKIVMSLSILAIVNNNIYTQAPLVSDPNRLDILPVTLAEFRALQDHTCAICLDEIRFEEAPEQGSCPYKTNCRQAVPHVFHERCIMAIRDDLCPLCRTPILRPRVQEQQRAQDLFTAARVVDINAIRELIENGVDVNIRDNNGYTALIYASIFGHENIARLLIENGADINIRNINGSAALTYASIDGNENIVRLLIENGVDVNIRDNTGDTALIYASMFGYENTVRLLIENRANVNIRNIDRCTALIYASINGHENIVRLLIENGADINIRDNIGRTALMLAMRYGRENIVRLLMMSELPHGLVE